MGGGPLLWTIFGTGVANLGELEGIEPDGMPGLGLEAFRAAFGEAAASMKFGGGYGIRMKDDGSGSADYYFWGGAANTFFWVDADDGITGTFFTHIAPIRYNLIDQIEEIIDEAREQ